MPMRLPSVCARSYLLCISLIEFVATVFHHGTGVLDDRPMVRGLCSIAAEFIAAGLCTSSIFPVTFVDVQATVKPIQSAKSMGHFFAMRITVFCVRVEIMGVEVPNQQY